LTYVFERQPDYVNWPEGEFFERKKAILDDLEREWNGYSMDDEDFQYLLMKSRHFYQLFAFTANLRLEMETELFAKDLEIDNLKQQLKDALGN
jgi:hypothetical protein